MLGENIRKVRKEKNKSAKYIAEKVGCSTQAILQYERGERTPSVKILEKICNALECNLMDIIDKEKNDKLNKSIEAFNNTISKMQNNTSNLIRQRINELLLSDNYICETNMCKDENFSKETKESIKFIENIYKNTFKPYKNIMENTQNLPDEAIKEVEEFTKYIKYKYSNKEGE